MANALQVAGATAEPTSFAPLRTDRIFTGLWTNRSFLRDAAITGAQETYGLGRQDSIWDGLNTEVTTRITLARRPGNSVYNPDQIAPVKRFYSFNTFTLTDELIRVMADTATQVLDITDGGYTAIVNKVAGAGSTFFLGVGNTLYMTNGAQNLQWNFGNNAVWPWGIPAPVNAPTVVQRPRPTTYGRWNPNMIYACWVDVSSVGAAVKTFWNQVVILGSDNRLHQWGTTNGAYVVNGQLGSHEPSWSSNPQQDGSIQWVDAGTGAWQAANGYGIGELIIAYIPVASGTDEFLFLSVAADGPSGYTAPLWTSAPQPGQQVQDGGVTWQNIGRLLKWADIATEAGLPSGFSNYITSGSQIIDPNGYLQNVWVMGVSSPTTSITFSTEQYALTTDALVTWQNQGPFSTQGSAPVQYGYAFMNSVTGDISNMSPASAGMIVQQGNQFIVSGAGSANPGDDTIIIYRTAQGGSTFLYADQIANPGAGNTWTWTDNTTDADLNTEWQAQVNGEGTPLPLGAGPLIYHMGRIWAGVGNVVYGSSGPDAVASASSGNAGFDTTFTCQSKVTRFWTTPVGLVVFTVDDCYIIQGSGTSSDPFYIVLFIANLPLKSYDCFAINKSTANLLLGNGMLVSLDPSAGITEIGFPIADRLQTEFDPSSSYLTFHSESSADSALYIANGTDRWYRLNFNNAPEESLTWSPPAVVMGTIGCVQSVEVYPGEYRLLMSPTYPGPVLQRDSTTSTDNGESYDAFADFGAIVLAEPGQLAGVSFLTLEALKIGSRPEVSLLLGEASGYFEPLQRTRQDPTNLPPSQTLYSDRYHFKQNQQCAWCRHMQMRITWPAEDAANELLSFTIFGENWQEMRAQ